MIYPGSPLLPRNDTEAVAYWVVFAMKPNASFNLIAKPATLVDIVSSSDLRTPLAFDKDDRRLIYEVKSEQLLLDITSKSPMKTWINNGKIVSTLDLGGSQLVFELIQTIVPDDGQLKGAIDNAFGAVSLESLHITIGDRQISLIQDSGSTHAEFTRNVVTTNAIAAVRYCFRVPPIN